MLLFPQDIFPEVEFLGHLVLILEKPPYCFPWWLCFFAFLSIVQRDSLFSMSLPVLLISCLFYKTHSNRYEMIAHSALYFHFPDSDPDGPVYHLYVFWKMCVQILCPSLTQTVCNEFFIHLVFIYLGINPSPYQIYGLKNFSVSIVCLFWLLKFSFALQNLFFSLM